MQRPATQIDGLVARHHEPRMRERLAGQEKKTELVPDGVHQPPGEVITLHRIDHDHNHHNPLTTVSGLHIDTRSRNALVFITRNVNMTPRIIMTVPASENT